jgi:DNA-directed RNA polymerase sigma subunit (sigma70/sigma32)
LKKKVNKIFFIIYYFIEPEIGQQLQELWRIETKNGIVEKMFVEEKDVNEIKKIEEKTLNLRNKMIDEQNDPEYVEKKIKEI